MDTWAEEKGLPLLVKIPLAAAGLSQYGGTLADIVVTRQPVKLPSGKALRAIANRMMAKALAAHLGR